MLYRDLDSLPWYSHNPDLQEVETVSVGTQLPEKAFHGHQDLGWEFAHSDLPALSHRHPVQQVHDELHESGGGTGQRAPL